MLVGIKRENDIIHIQYILSKEQEEQLKSEPFNFKILDIGVIDVKATDFNSDLTFSFDKYNARKQKERNADKIIELKQKLRETDYQAIKHFEGCLTDYEYEPIKAQRQAWRDEINELEKLI